MNKKSYLKTLSQLAKEMTETKLERFKRRFKIIKGEKK